MSFYALNLFISKKRAILTKSQKCANKQVFLLYNRAGSKKLPHSPQQARAIYLPILIADALPISCEAKRANQSRSRTAAA